MVLDEADLLMGGGFHRDVTKILKAMQSDDADSKASLISHDLGVSIEDFRAKPRGDRKKALQGVWLSQDLYFTFQREGPVCVKIALGDLISRPF